jgi:glycerol transport system ATP-binding protein
VQIEEPSDTSGYVPAEVDQVEIHGGFQIVSAVLEGTDIEVKARVAHDDDINEDDAVWLKFPSANVRLFHKQQSLEAA